MTHEHPIYTILRHARSLGASDVHICANRSVAIRVDGSIERPWSGRIVSASELDALWDQDGLGPVRARLAKEGCAEASLSVRAQSEGAEPIGPVRIHATMTTDGVHLAMRLLALQVPDVGSLGLPMRILDLARRQSGLILFVGPTGSGKTTAMASLVQTLLAEQKKHVVVIGDPIEYRLQPGAGIVSHIEVGESGQVASYVPAVHSASRQDPDVLLISESRDTATMAAAIEAAEHGRLCLTTVHARDAGSVFDRIVGAFAPHAQPQIRVSLANSIAAVVVLRLLPRNDGPGRVPACELLLATDAVRSLIRDDATGGLRNLITTSGQTGMQTLEADISRLVYDRGIVAEEVGRAAAVRPEEVRPGDARPAASPAGPARSMFGGA